MATPTPEPASFVRELLRAGGLAFLAFMAVGSLCMCGHADWITVLIAGPPFVFGVRGVALRAYWGLYLCPVLLATPFLAKAASDMLWHGHEPLLGAEPSFLLIPATYGFMLTLLALGGGWALAKRRATAREAEVLA